MVSGMNYAVWSGQIAIVIGTVSFVLAFLPIVIWQHRKYGDWDHRRLLGAALASTYAASLVTYTLLPLPDVATVWCNAHAKGVQLEPFYFVDEITLRTAGLPWRQAVKHAASLQVIFNVIFFIPWGVLARRWAGMSILMASVTGFGASLLIETTQASGLWGIYPCAYRLGDVDDLFLNTLGAVVGAVLAPAFLWWMPSSRALAATREVARPVTTRRRYTGMVVDQTMAVTLLSTVVLLGGFGCEPFLSCDGQQFEHIGRIGAPIVWAVVWGVPALRGSGASLGQRMIWLEPRWPDRTTGVLVRGTVYRRLLRSLVVPGIWMVGVMVPMMAGVVMAALMLAVVLVPVTRTRGLSGLVSGAVYVDSRQQQDDSRSQVSRPGVEACPGRPGPGS